MASSLTFFDVAVFLLSKLSACWSFMSISWLVLELWQLLLITDWPEIGISEIPPSKFCPVFEDWGELDIPKLARMFLIKCYWILQNDIVAYPKVSEIFKILRPRFCQSFSFIFKKSLLKKLKQPKLEVFKWHFLTKKTHKNSVHKKLVNLELLNYADTLYML